MYSNLVKISYYVYKPKLVSKSHLTIDAIVLISNEKKNLQNKKIKLRDNVQDTHRKVQKSSFNGSFSHFIKIRNVS